MYRALLEPYAEGEALERVVRYAELLDRWAAHHNLVSYTGPEELVERHLREGLAAVRHLGAGGVLADIGSGAGLPGVPLLSAAGDGWRGVLVEPRQKRWAFLRTVVRELGLAAEVVPRRYRELPGDRRFDRITARGVGGHEALASWARERLRPGGRLMLWVGSGAVPGLRSLAGWRVVSCAVPCSQRGWLVLLEPCFT